MKKLTTVLFAVCSCMLLWSFQCRKGEPDPPLFFEGVPVERAVAAGFIDEASGLADSKANPGFLWVNEDSQRPIAIHLLKHDGQYQKKIVIKNATNRDWEELALANGPEAGKNYIYLAETGDNYQVYSDYLFYRFEEPSMSADTVFQFDIIRFKYPDGSHDSEAFFVDPSTKDIYVITKRDTKSKVYKIAYPQSTSSLNTASFVVDLPYNMGTAASISNDGTEVLIKNYSEIYYYRRGVGQSIADMLYPGIIKLTYAPEPQGEAIAFAADNSGYFTLSEKAFVPSVSLNFYKRR